MIKNTKSIYLLPKIVQHCFTASLKVCKKNQAVKPIFFNTFFDKKLHN